MSKNMLLKEERFTSAEKYLPGGEVNNKKTNMISWIYTPSRRNGILCYVLYAYNI